MSKVPLSSTASGDEATNAWGCQPLHRNVLSFRGELVFKAHRLCVSLNSRLESNTEEKRGCPLLPAAQQQFRTRVAEGPNHLLLNHSDSGAKANVSHCWGVRLTGSSDTTVHCGPTLLLKSTHIETCQLQTRICTLARLEMRFHEG